jgi:FkbM family methyltransferase
MRKFIRKLIGYLGYDVIKVIPTPIIKKDQMVRVGNYAIKMPAINPLIYVYKNDPDFAKEIGRIASHIFSKYPDLSVVDIGANTGDTAAIIKTIADIPIICIEGDTLSYSYLKENCKQFNNTLLLNHFLGEKPQTVSVNLEKKGWNTTIVPENEATEKITLTTLDELFSHFYNEKMIYKLLKIDTEGFDTIILRGALNFIEKNLPVIYIEYNRESMSVINETGLQTLLALKKIGYTKILLFDDRGRYIITLDMENEAAITDMHNYADGKNGLIYYYNLCIVHRSDIDIALHIRDTEITILSETKERKKMLPFSLQ